MLCAWALAVPALGGCAVASASAGAAISVTGAVVSTGVALTGKAIGAGIDAARTAPAPGDASGIVVRERIRPADDSPGAAAPRTPPCAPDAGEGDHTCMGDAPATQPGVLRF